MSLVRTIFGFILSGLSAAGLYFYGISVDPQILPHVEDSVAATPSPILSFDEVLPLATPSVVETYLPDARDKLPLWLESCQIIELEQESAAARGELRTFKIKERQDELTWVRKKIILLPNIARLENQVQSLTGDHKHMSRTTSELMEENQNLETKVDSQEIQVKTLRPPVHLPKGSINQSAKPAGVMDSLSMSIGTDAISKCESLAKENQQALQDKKRRDTNHQIAIDALKEEIKNKDGRTKALKASSSAVDNMSKTSGSAFKELWVQYGISQGKVVHLNAEITGFESGPRRTASGSGSAEQALPPFNKPSSGTSPNQKGGVTMRSVFLSNHSDDLKRGKLLICATK
ncbi:MAG: hypothetical protein LQ337_004619 [Flavoplaca oasis]|nr:MAG: hypothetical protein LQ337_004619 [Flavoplaca oasis]